MNLAKCLLIVSFALITGGINCANENYTFQQTRSNPSSDLYEYTELSTGATINYSKNGLIPNQIRVSLPETIGSKKFIHEISNLDGESNIGESARTADVDAHRSSPMTDEKARAKLVSIYNAFREWIKGQNL